MNNYFKNMSGFYPKLLLIILSVISNNAVADIRVTSDSGRRLNLGTWNGNSSLNSSKELCVTSVQGRRRNSTIPLPYRIQLSPRGNNSADGFALSLGSDRIPFSARFVDLTNSNSEQILPSVYTSQNYNGALNNCPDGNNGQIQISVNSSDLNNVLAGRYVGRYRLTAQGGNNANQTASQNINIIANIDEVIKISNVENFIINRNASNGAINEEISLCVYRNSIGTYQVTATGNGLGGFSLNNGTDILNYAITLDDGSSTTTMTSGVPLTNRQNVNNSSSDCNNGADDNVSMTLSISESEISNKPAGVYLGILTLIVSPE